MTRYWLALGAVWTLLGCQQDPLGGPCNNNRTIVYKDDAIKPKDGDFSIGQDPSAFLNCETFICLSSNGSVPYCTRRCAGDGECSNGRGVPMSCEVVTEFGALACREPSARWCPDGSPPEEQCCERNEDTRAVKDKAKYCVAKNGAIAHDPRAEQVGGGSSGLDAGP